MCCCCFWFGNAFCLFAKNTHKKIVRFFFLVVCNSLCASVCVLFVYYLFMYLNCRAVSVFSTIFINIYLVFYSLWPSRSSSGSNSRWWGHVVALWICVCSCCSFWFAKIPTKLDETKCFHLTKHRERKGARERKQRTGSRQQAAASIQQPPSQQQRAKQRRWASNYSDSRKLPALLLLLYNIYFNFDFFLAFSSFVRRYPLFCMPPLFVCVCALA